MQPREGADYAKVSVQSAFSLLNAAPTGITEEDAVGRLRDVGYNEVSEKRKSPIIDVLSRYWGPMPWLLELTMILSYIIHDYLEVGIIFALLTVNVTIGFHHAQSSRNALELLKKRLAPRAKVLRDGQWRIKDARELVPGDIVQVGLGDLVPADIKIVQGNLSVDQSALTGESLPVNLGESGVVYSSSIVKGG